MLGLIQDGRQWAVATRSLPDNGWQTQWDGPRGEGRGCLVMPCIFQIINQPGWNLGKDEQLGSSTTLSPTTSRWHYLGLIRAGPRSVVHHVHNDVLLLVGRVTRLGGEAPGERSLWPGTAESQRVKTKVRCPSSESPELWLDLEGCTSQRTDRGVLWTLGDHCLN